MASRLHKSLVSRNLCARMIQQRQASALDQNSLMRGTIPTMHFQKSMPRLPIPKLEDTVARFSDSVQPLLSEAEFNEFKKVLASYEKNEGISLHKKLVDFAETNSHSSYITSFWFDMYLKDRRQIVFTHTPVIVAIPPPNADISNPYLQSTRCANTIVSALKFKAALDNQTLYPDVFHMNNANINSALYDNLCRFTPQKFSYFSSYFRKSYPLDMSQYKNLFASTRLPREEKDELVVNPGSRNVVFLRNGHLYSINVLSEQGKIIDPLELMQNIEYILEDSSNPAFPPGVYTTTDRDSWSKVRNVLLELDGNEEAFRLVDGAIFVVSLEDYTAGSAVSEIEQSVKKLLIGDGRNRWYDKSLNMIFLKDGTFAVQFEHSWGDGVSVVRFLNDVCKDSFENPALPYSMTQEDFLPITRTPTQVQKEVKRLKISTDADSKEVCKDAMLQFDRKAESLNFSVYKGGEGFGKKFAKQAKVSPDSLMQLCIQLGYFQISDGKTVPTYESCSTAGFKHGRTETVRACTMETKRFTEAFFGSNTSKSELQSLMKACSDKHNDLTKKAATGQGCDRHLFAMKQLARAENPDKLPELFRHELYDRVHQFILSTSTVPSDYCLAGAFCPVVPNGLGVGYEIADNSLGFAVTSYEKSLCSDFTQSMSEITNKLQGILS